MVTTEVIDWIACSKISSLLLRPKCQSRQSIRIFCSIHIFYLSLSLSPYIDVVCVLVIWRHVASNSRCRGRSCHAMRCDQRGWTSGEVTWSFPRSTRTCGSIADLHESTIELSTGLSNFYESSYRVSIVLLESHSETMFLCRFNPLSNICHWNADCWISTVSRSTSWKSVATQETADRQ